MDPDARAAWVSAERTRPFRLIEELMRWDNSANEPVRSEVRAEIMRSTDGKPPPILHPFAGGGTIPLEAQRLGLDAHASDLNPVAVLINKALIEIPPKFAGRPPVFPGVGELKLGEWPRSTGLAEDVRRYGAWMRDEAEKRIGHMYPKAILSDGSKAPVIAWIWARTVACPNPACGTQMPLVRSWWLGKRRARSPTSWPGSWTVRFTSPSATTRRTRQARMWTGPSDAQERAVSAAAPPSISSTSELKEVDDAVKAVERRSGGGVRMAWHVMIISPFDVTATKTRRSLGTGPVSARASRTRRQPWA